MTCSVGGCSLPATRVKLYCEGHYKRLWRAGVRFPRTRPADERFWEKVNKTDSCWLWTAATNGAGYGVLGMQSAPRGHVYAHRFSYELRRGAIPEGMQLDHICRTTRCVNPDHLEAVTPKTNYLRGASPSAINAAKTMCPLGHELAPKSNGKRFCPTCHNAQRRQRRSKT